VIAIDFSDATPKPGPVRNVRLGPGTLAATLGAVGVAASAVWWSLRDRDLIGSSAIFPPACVGKRRRRFVEPVFTPDLARCAAHGFEYGSGSVVFDSVVVVAPGVSYERGVPLALAGDYWEMGLDALAVSPDSRWLLAVGGGLISRWDLRKVKAGRKSEEPVEAGTLVLGRDGEEDDWERDVVAVAFSPDGKVLATGHADGEVRLYNLRSRKQVAVLQPPARASKDVGIKELTFSSDGGRLAARSARRITVLDRARKAVVARLDAGEPTGAAFHPDGTRLLTGGLDGRVRVWDSATWRQVGQYDWEVGPVHSVAVSPDGFTAAVGGDDSRVVVWDVDP
jgi:WD40 repeat protein